jgi:DNA polymerase III sliding clamp (beta) subunit (PCNA family)
MQKHNREELLKALETVSAAIANNVVVPILHYIGFTGTTIFAYNSFMAIRTPLETEFEGAVHGEMLIDILKSWNAEEVELEVETIPKAKEGNPTRRLIVKAGKESIAKFEMEDNLENFNYLKDGNLPEAGKSSVIEDPNFFIAIDCCIRSIDNDPSIPDQTGVTLISENGTNLDVYSTDTSSLSWVSLELPHPINLKNRVILKEEFCKQMLKLKSDSPVLELDDDAERAFYTDGTTVLDVKYVTTNKPVDFKEIRNHYEQKVIKGKPRVPFPDNLESALNSAIIVADKIEGKYMKVSIKKPGKLHLYASTPDKIELSEFLEINDKHPLITDEISVEPARLKKGTSFFEKWLITDKAVLMEKDNMTYLVAVLGE